MLGNAQGLGLLIFAGFGIAEHVEVLIQESNTAGPAWDGAVPIDGGIDVVQVLVDRAHVIHPNGGREHVIVLIGAILAGSGIVRVTVELFNSGACRRGEIVPGNPGDQHMTQRVHSSIMIAKAWPKHEQSIAVRILFRESA